MEHANIKICLIEPFFSGSHAAWAEEYANHSAHQIELLTLKGRHWKWRMHGGAVSLAAEYLKRQIEPDLILATDMLDLATFLALTRNRTAHIPCACYFHENQLSYPWSPTDADPTQKRDAHYAFINYTSALSADLVLFNSPYHRRCFLVELPLFLKGFPDGNESQNAALIEGKSQVLSLALDLKRLDRYRPQQVKKAAAPPLILWNHRWEYDKNPDDFFATLFQLADEDLDFEVAILGESYRQTPAIFNKAAQQLGRRIIHFGYAPSFADYAHWLWRADLLPVTSRHDFFGASVVQAIYCGCVPLLPNRLAYPEHLPPTREQTYVYNAEEELRPKLRAMLRTPLVRDEELIQHVARYDWQTQVAHYDELLAANARERKP